MRAVLVHQCPPATTGHSPGPHQLFSIPTASRRWPNCSACLQVTASYIPHLLPSPPGHLAPPGRECSALMLCADPSTLGLRTFAHAVPRPEKAFSFFIPQLSHSLDSQSLWPGLWQHPSLLQQGHRIKEWSIGRALCPSSPGDGPKLCQPITSCVNHKCREWDFGCHCWSCSASGAVWPPPGEKLSEGESDAEESSEGRQEVTPLSPWIQPCLKVHNSSVTRGRKLIKILN